MKLRGSTRCRYIPAMGRESRNAAVLFADVSESSALYRRLGDAAARRVINGCLENLCELLPRHRGQLVKTLGDAILCIFAAPDDALLAASAMQARAARAEPGPEHLALHIGLHYGPVLCEGGDVFGDTVNIAAYLTSAALRDQILTTEITEGEISPALKGSVRPLFSAVLKGSGRESLVYEVLWNAERADMTDVNGAAHRVIPGDTGSLLVSFGATWVRLDQWRASMRIGRAPECDIVVADRYISRQHVTIRARRTRFYLIDHSINGTYVKFEGGAESHVLRGELLLERRGELTLGRSRAHGADEVITFGADRRSMFRV